MGKLNIINEDAYDIFNSIVKTECEIRKIPYEFKSDMDIGHGQTYSSESLKPTRISFGSEGLDKREITR